MKAFEKIDINGDGTLSKEELTYALEKTDCQYLPH
jgi:Ca2+-binding EF-hand superfamily protein